MLNRRIVSWCLFDFANSSYSAVIAAVVFPVYYTTVIVGNEAGLGDLWWGRAISLSMALVALSSPFMGGLADLAGRRKGMLGFYTALCVAAVASFTLLEPGMAAAGFLLVVLANIGMEGGLVFYNSFLPTIAPHTHQGRVSAWGFGVGYAGSILALLAALFLIRQGTVTLAWPMVALFFAVFSLPAFLFLPPDSAAGTPVAKAALSGFRSTTATLREILGDRDRRRFLIAYFVYEDGVNTVIVFSSIFAATTLRFSPTELVMLYLVVQGTALAGAFLMARPIDVRGPKRVVMATLCLWMSVSLLAFFAESKPFFFGIATLAGLGLGTVQAATRAFFSQFVPAGREAEYFGVYALVGKTSAIMGPLVFGTVSSTLGSQRPAVLAVGLFFVVGLLLLTRVRGGGPNVGGG